jgi:hypothetical protein
MKEILQKIPTSQSQVSTSLTKKLEKVLSAFQYLLMKKLQFLSCQCPRNPKMTVRIGKSQLFTGILRDSRPNS